MRRPVVAALPVIAVLLFLATPLFSVTFGTPDERVLPTNAAGHQVGDALRNDFATTPDVIDVLITPALPQPELQSYTQQLSHLSGVQRADISVGSASAGQPTSQRVRPEHRTGLGLRRSAGPGLGQVRAVSAPREATVLVGGATATLRCETGVSSTCYWPGR
jgi:RND superfamily putative drug exporter